LRQEGSKERVKSFSLFISFTHSFGLKQMDSIMQVKGNEFLVGDKTFFKSRVSRASGEKVRTKKAKYSWILG